MALIESIGGKLLPVGPDFFEHLGVVPILLSAGDKLRLHMVQLIAQLLTHSLTQGIALASGKVSQKAREKHHLLLIDRNAVGVLQVLLHDGDVILDGLAAPFAVNEVRNVVHRSRTVEGIHGDEVLKRAGLQLTQILLHTGRFKLEGTNGTSLTVELIGLRVIDGDGININHLSRVKSHILHGLLDDGERLQPQEVHLDKSRVFNHTAFILGDEHFFTRLLIVCRTHRYPVSDVITADDGATGMDSCTTHVTLQHLGVLHRIAYQGVR